MSEKSHSNLILFINTAEKTSEIAIFSSKILVAKKITDSAELSVSLLKDIEDLLVANGYRKDDLGKIAVFAGPGSYTGLRVGITIANNLGLSLGIPVIAASLQNDKLVEKLNNNNFILPKYLAEPHITKQRKLFGSGQRK